CRSCSVTRASPSRSTLTPTCCPAWTTPSPTEWKRRSP
ncbi:MAG: hypothetical protein AVDCRST_MAG55-1643, partial [uncultured Rubrobacteraceae bacterium]